MVYFRNPSTCMYICIHICFGSREGDIIIYYYINKKFRTQYFLFFFSGKKIMEIQFCKDHFESIPKVRLTYTRYFIYICISVYLWRYSRKSRLNDARRYKRIQKNAMMSPVQVPGLGLTWSLRIHIMIEDALKTDTQNAFNTQRVKQRVLCSQNS